MCFSDEHAPALALKVTEATFTSRVNQTLAKTAIEYILQYKKAPGAQLDYILEKPLRSGEEGKLLRKTIELLAQQAPQLHAQFVLDELDRFVEIKALSGNLQIALETLQQGELEKAREHVYKFTAPKIDSKSGIWLKDPSQSLRFLYRAEESQEYFSTGVKALDEAGVALDRKTIAILIASSGKGKTWWLTEVGKHGLMHHHPTLHITLELSEEKTAKRYIQSLFALTKDDVKDVKIPYFNNDPSQPIQFKELRRESVFAKKKEIARKLEGMKSFPPLLIKEFPTSSLTIEQLDLYLDSLERDKGFIPELVILDYPDLMRLNIEALRVDTGRLYRDLRGLAMERNFALATVTQGNRDAANAKLVDNDNVAEDWSKIGTADLVMTYNQTAAEKKLGLARMFVSKYRDGRDRFVALLSQSYEIGQYAIDSTIMRKEMDQQIEAASAASA